jgi:hypothetical protein
MSPKMIETANHALIDPLKRQPVNNILFCSGGGIQASFFTLGAIKQLLDNDKFLNTFDIITSASGSGSTITANIIELCYDNNIVGAVAGWYELYVVGTMHKIFDDNYVVNLLKKIPFSKEKDIADKFFDIVTSYFRQIPYLKNHQNVRY